MCHRYQKESKCVIIPLMSRERSGGAEDGMAGRSDPLDTQDRTSLKLLPAHGRRPVYISQRIIPKAKISIFSEHGSFLKASGAIYRGVPAKFERVFTNCPIFSAARPKSQSFKRLDPSNMRFSGLTSRWTTPHKCKNCGTVKQPH